MPVCDGKDDGVDGGKAEGVVAEVHEAMDALAQVTNERDNALQTALQNLLALPEDMVGRKRGRPGQEAPRFCVETWIASERSVVYKPLFGAHLDGATFLTTAQKKLIRAQEKKIPYWCIACRKSLLVQQTGTLRFLQIHEKNNAAHEAGIKRILGIRGPELATVPRKASVPRQCQGILVHEQGDGGLACIAGSVRRYCWHQCPAYTTCDFGKYLTMESGSIRLTSPHCLRVGAGEDDYCAECYKFSCGSGEHCPARVISDWVHKMDCCDVTLAALTKAPEDKQSLIDEVKGRDYMKQHLAGKDFDKFLVLAPHAMVSRVMDLWKRNRTSERSESMVKYIQAKVDPLSTIGSSGIGNDVYRSLVTGLGSALAAGQVQKSHLRAAAELATSQAKGAGVVATIAMSMLTCMRRISEGYSRRTSSKVGGDGGSP